MTETIGQWGMAGSALWCCVTQASLRLGDQVPSLPNGLMQAMAWVLNVDPTPWSGPWVACRPLLGASWSCGSAHLLDGHTWILEAQA